RQPVVGVKHELPAQPCLAALRAKVVEVVRRRAVADAVEEDQVLRRRRLGERGRARDEKAQCDPGKTHGDRETPRRHGGLTAETIGFSAPCRDAWGRTSSLGSGTAWLRRRRERLARTSGKAGAPFRPRPCPARRPGPAASGPGRNRPLFSAALS